MSTAFPHVTVGAILEPEHVNRYSAPLNALEDWRSGVVPSLGDQDLGGFRLEGLAAGNAAAPGFSLSGDADTGLFSPAADALAVATGGTERGRFDADGLAVTGFKMSSGAAAGRVLTTDSGGTATWQPLPTQDHGALLGLADDDHLQYAHLLGRSGGQNLAGGTAAGETLTLRSTTHATRGKILLGSASAYDEANDRLGLGTSSPSQTLEVVGTIQARLAASGTPLRLDGPNAAGGSQTLQFGYTAGFAGKIESVTRTSGGGSLVFHRSPNGTTHAQVLRLDSDGDLVLGDTSALSTSATTGFPFLPTMAGVPSGTPGSYGSNAPMVVDTSNHRLHFRYGSAWHAASLSDQDLRAGSSPTFQSLALVRNTSGTGLRIDGPDAAGGSQDLQFGYTSGFAGRIRSVTRSGGGGSLEFYSSPTGSTHSLMMTLHTDGSVVLGSGALSTSATDGFLYLPTVAGAPSGTPTSQTGRAPMVVDSTNNRLYVYSGGSWKYAALV